MIILFSLFDISDVGNDRIEMLTLKEKETWLKSLENSYNVFN